MNKLLQYLISETNVEHRVLPGLQKMQTVKPIVDPRGQWAHPGKITRIPSDNITMQGVNYPVYGVGSNGQQQMMYPEQEYNFGGASYVDEYPMMQFGGGTLLGPLPMMSKIVPKVVSMFSGDPLKKFINWVNEPSETTGSTSRPSPLPVEAPVRTYGYSDTDSEYRDRANDVYSELKNNDSKEYNSPKQISLSSGRFRGAKVDPEMINDIVNAAKANNVDPWVMLSLVGRESTFGSGAAQNTRRAGNKQDLVSGWNVAEEYMPYEFNRFLADRQVPGVKVHKDNHGWQYTIEDKKVVDDYLKKNPQLIDSYYKKIESTPNLDGLDSFALAAQRIKKKGIQNYNPGDPKYSSMVNSDMGLLKQDAELKAYMKSKGYREGGQLGSGLLSKSVSCSNCGWSWKAVDGGIAPMTCHKCGGVVKMQNGGQPNYNSILDQNAADAEKYPSAYHKDFVTGYPVANSAGSIPRPGGFDCPPGYTKYKNPDGTFFCNMTNPAPGSSITDVSHMTKMADDMQFSRPMQGGGQTGANLQEDVEKFLNYPMSKAESTADKYTKPGEDQPDNLRHSLAGMYTRQAIQRKTGNIPVLSSMLGFLGTTAAGLGHELIEPNRGTAKRPYTWGQTIREGAEDQFNNMVGSLIGSLPFMSEKKKIETLKYLSDNNMLPDGYGRNVDNMYFKKQCGGIIPRAQDGRTMRAANGEFSCAANPRSDLRASAASVSGGSSDPLRDAKNDYWGRIKEDWQAQGVNKESFNNMYEDSLRAGPAFENPLSSQSFDPVTGKARPGTAGRLRYYKEAGFPLGTRPTLEQIKNTALQQPNGMKGYNKLVKEDYPWGVSPYIPTKEQGGQYGGLDRWFAEKWVDVKTGKDCGRQEGESRAGYPACRPSKRVNSQTPKTSSEMSSAEKAKFKSSKTSSQRIDYNHKRNK
jgi:hypothetical protein